VRLLWPFFLLLPLSFPLSAFGQGLIRDSSAFADHLFNEGLYPELRNFRAELPPSPLRDSLTLLCARSYGKEGDWRNTYRTLRNTGLVEHGGFSVRSYYFRSLLHRGLLTDADEALTSFRRRSLLEPEWIQHHRLAVSLIQGDLEEHDSLSASFHFKDAQLEGSLAQMNELKEDLRWIRGKDPWKAGVLAGVLPGAGELYLNKPREAFSTFFQHTLLGFQAWRGFRMKGFEDPHFYLFGGLFTVFYIGNIWGSVLQIESYERDKKRQIRHQVLDDVDRIHRTRLH
jgi:hypothetical protein